MFVIAAQLVSWPGTPVVPQTFPAQSPLSEDPDQLQAQHLLGRETHQRVVSKMREWSWKNSDVLHELEGKLAIGVPHASGLGAPAVMSSGMELRSKKWTVMLVSSHFTA